MSVDWSGLQVFAAVAVVASEHVRLVSITLLATATTSTSRPERQVSSQPLLAVLPFIVLERVAASLCPSALLLHVALSCPLRTRYPCVQQYPPTAKVLSAVVPPLRFLPVEGVWLVFLALAKMVYVAVREATLVVRVAMLAVSVALVSMSCAKVDRSVVAAAARLSRYPSSRVKVSGEIVASSPPKTA